MADIDPKRRRGPGVITQLACTECRKKRAKCDGQTPCRRCLAHQAKCTYEALVKQTKEEMRAEIERLRAQQATTDQILAALMVEEKTMQILLGLRGGACVQDIVEKLEAIIPGEVKEKVESETEMDTSDNLVDGPEHQVVVRKEILEAFMLDKVGNGEWEASATFPSKQDAFHGRNPEPPAASQSGMQWSPTEPTLTTPWLSGLLAGSHNTITAQATSDKVHEARVRGQEILFAGFKNQNRHPSIYPTLESEWTNVTTDGEFVEHLMALYFCWEYPSFASLSKEHFLGDFRAGRTDNCSSLLVNAMLGVGCRFSADGDARLDPTDCNTAGDHFFIEAERLLESQKNCHVMTTIQAIGLMSLHQASRGRSTESMFLSGQSIRLAIEMGLHVPGGNAIDQTVRTATFWGAYSLDQAWSLCIGRLPHFSKITQKDVRMPVLDRLEASAWVPYTDAGAPSSGSASQPSNVRCQYQNLCELSEVIHDTLYVLYDPTRILTGKKLLDVYNQYIHWYDSIPEVLRFGRNSTPTVLFAHIYYHFAILLLFRPFLKMDIIGSGVSPSDLCTQAADAISALTKSYSDLYSLTRTPSLVPYIIMTSTIAHMYDLGNCPDSTFNETLEKVLQSYRDLNSMKISHGFAIRAQHILQRLVRKWGTGIQLPSWGEKLKRGTEESRLKSESRPRTEFLNMFGVSLGNTASIAVVEQSGDGMEGLDGEGNLERETESALFTPFYLQGLPLLGTSKEELEEAGFRLRL